MCFRIAMCLIGMFLSHTILQGQCVADSNVYSFQFRGKNYEVIRENKTWLNAVGCAKDRGGYLVEINDSIEQDTVFYQVINNAKIVFSKTYNIFNTSAIWMGGTDTLAEGNWIWDGNNDGIGNQFWSGGPKGTKVNGLYTNWGISPAEPDNSGGQNHLCLTIDGRKVNYGKWNDIKSNDRIYFIIEYDAILKTKVEKINRNIQIFPNPIHDFIKIKFSDEPAVSQIKLLNSVGQVIRSMQLDPVLSVTEINISDLNHGFYFVQIEFVDGNSQIHKIIKY
ncbi:MAG: T9SS type A sorting domain-containing protein [Saprospiraceae bacterium]